MPADGGPADGGDGSDGADGSDGNGGGEHNDDGDERLVAASPDGVLRLDGAGRVVEADPTATAAVAASEGGVEDPVGEHVTDALPGIESGRRSLSAVVDGDHRRFELRPPDGPADGTVLLRDVTDREGQVDAIQRYETIVDALGDPVYVIDADGRFAFVNEAFEERFGYAPGELLGERIGTLFAEPGIDRARREIDALLSSDDRRSTVFERTVVTADGERVPVEDNLALLPDDGEFRGTAGVLRDVTERNRRLAELEQYETIVQALPDPVYATDETGAVTFANRAFEEQLGYDHEAVTEAGRHLSEFTTADDTETILEALRSMVGEGDRFERRTVEIDGVTADGRTVPLEGSLALLPNDGEFRGSAGVLRNVAERKRREEVFTVMNRALRHNLRTNVNTISGYAEVLAEDAAGEQLAHLQRIRDAADWLAKLGDTLRTLQDAIDESLTEGRSVTVGDLVEGAVDRVRGDHPGATVSTHHATRGAVEAGFPLRYAVENVVENGVVHNDRDDPRVDVWVADAPRDGWIDVHVEDDGPGIPDDERSVVLGEATIDQLQHGSGIGLWITRWIVQVFDGEIRIEDNEPRGSVVTLRLRRADGG